jgi:A/G-specific adenine glycosylase
MTILAWFEQYARPFPWRQPGLTAYDIIISEVLLQRTTAAAVSKVYPLFLLNYPNWQSLANADINTLAENIAGLGLQLQRSRRLQALACSMVANQCILPQERAQLDIMPFMGQYIANAVELLIHKKNKPLLDVNMARVLERYFGARKLKDIRYDPYLQKLAHDIVDHPKSKEINWAILDFAAIICQARKPKCNICVFQTTCQYYLITKKTRVDN